MGQMKTALWYHTRLFGGNPPLNPDYSITLMTQQMARLKTSGLLDAASALFVCVNGNGENRTGVRCLAPAKAQFIEHGPQAESLLPTINVLRLWCMANPDWLVCFFHIKGVTHPWDPLTTYWRGCMEKWVIGHWQTCVKDMGLGYDTVGAHWLTPEQYPGLVRHPFWGGQFFWAKSSFLAELPELPNAPACRDDWFLSENWIGMGRRPKAKDYAHHWPSLQDCGVNAQ